MLTRDKAYQLIDKIVAASRFEVVVAIDYKDLSLTRYANSEIHQNMASVDGQVSITVFDLDRMATVVTNVLSEEAVLSALNAAELMLPLLPPTGMFFEQLEGFDEILVEDYDDQFNVLWDTEARARAIGGEIHKLPADYIASGAFEVTHSALAWGNRKGVRRFVSGSSGHLEVMVTHQDGASGFADVIVKSASALSVVDAFAFARDKAQAGRSAEVLAPGRYTVVLEPAAVNDLISYLGYIGCNSKFHIDGLSPFVGKLGDQVAVPAFNLEDMAGAEGMIRIPFDVEGYPRQRLKVIEDGVFRGIAYDTITARANQAKTTGHSLGYRGEGGMPLNLVVRPGDTSREALIASVEKGLLVSRFHYMNIVDPTTGTMTALTRDGLYKIEKGQVKGAVKNLRFTDALPRILMAISGIANDVTTLPSFMGSNQVVSLRVEDFHFTGGTTLEAE